VQVTETIGRLIEPVIASLGYELLGVEYLPQGRHSLLRVYIDSEAGIGLEDCATVSRQISAVLDVEDPIHGQYNLEVSSPGVERPLFKPQHFERVLGEKIRVRLAVPRDGRRKYKGILVESGGGHITLHDEDGEDYRIALADIEKANVVFEG